MSSDKSAAASLPTLGGAKPALTELGAKSIELYQNHLSLVDRIWAYFSTYSAMLVLMAAVVAAARDQSYVNGLGWRLYLPVVLYFCLAIGNHIALGLTLDELHQIRAIANGYSQY